MTAGNNTGISRNGILMFMQLESNKTATVILNQKGLFESFPIGSYSGSVGPYNSSSTDATFVFSEPDEERQKMLITASNISVVIEAIWDLRTQKGVNILQYKGGIRDLQNLECELEGTPILEIPKFDNCKLTIYTGITGLGSIWYYLNLNN